MTHDFNFIKDVIGFNNSYDDDTDSDNDNEVNRPAARNETSQRRNNVQWPFSPFAVVCVAMLIAFAFLGGWQAKAWNEQNLIRIIDQVASKTSATTQLDGVALANLGKSTESLMTTSNKLESAQQSLSEAASALRASVSQFDVESDEFVTQVAKFNDVVDGTTKQFQQVTNHLVVVIGQTSVSQQLEACKAQLGNMSQLKLDVAAANSANIDLLRWMMRTAVSLQEFSLAVVADTVAGASGRCSNRIDELRKELNETQANYSARIATLMQTAEQMFQQNVAMLTT